MRRIVIRAHSSEKASRLLDEENTITLIVEREANKHDIARYLESTYGVKVLEVRTMITSRGEKKAYVKLSPEHKARDLAVKMGMV